MNRDEARALLAGPLGEQLGRFPLRWCKPAFFGIPPEPGNQLEVKSGTASLIARGEDHFAITCRHVVEEYRLTRAKSDTAFFHIGNCAIDPLGQLLAEGEGELDVAVLRLTPEQAARVVHGNFGIGEGFFPIEQRRPDLVEEGIGVAFAGFPGALRRVQALNELNFGTYSCGATPVTASNDVRFICQFERDEWVRQGIEPDPATLGGLSGGPAFSIQYGAAGIMTYAFAGIIYVFSEEFELLYIDQAQAIYDLMGW